MKEIWVDAEKGDDANDGDINSPLRTEIEEVITVLCPKCGELIHTKSFSDIRCGKCQSEFSLDDFDRYSIQGEKLLRALLQERNAKVVSGNREVIFAVYKKNNNALMNMQISDMYRTPSTYFVRERKYTQWGKILYSVFGFSSFGIEKKDILERFLER